jgi:hypothetical protein
VTNFKSCREGSESTYDLPDIKIQGVAGAVWQPEMLTQSDREDGKKSTLSPPVICKF